MAAKLTPKKWIAQVFGSDIAKRGGHVRRKLSSIDRFASRDDLTAEVKKRGYHIVEIGDQWVIVCNKGNVKLIT